MTIPVLRIPDWKKLQQRIGDASGQSTVEFAIVTAALVVIVLGLGALWHLFGDGKVVAHAVAAAPYHIQGGNDGVLADAFAA